MPLILELVAIIVAMTFKLILVSKFGLDISYFKEISK